MSGEVMSIRELRRLMRTKGKVSVVVATPLGWMDTTRAEVLRVTRDRARALPVKVAHGRQVLAGEDYLVVAIGWPS